MHREAKVLSLGRMLLSLMHKVAEMLSFMYLKGIILSLVTYFQLTGSPSIRELVVPTFPVSGEGR